MYIELPFLAPIPVGNEVVVQSLERPTFFGGWEESEWIVLDRTTGIVWSPCTVPMGLTRENFHSHHLGDHRRRRPNVAPTLGRVVACQVSTKGIGETNHVVTGLTLAPLEATAYR
ncbi:hypothetical protein [Sorangium sp. So ce341]|uniref:hypothetical protein n=1 Tax=Sorangium sp. So ce341 TaxID=3133302 RepID=UPI003F622490